jgi:hypothetical protein
MFQTLLSIIKGIDDESSTKRVLLLWVGGPVWGFINVAVFLFHKRFSLPDDLPGTIAMYDFLLICGLAGLTVYERVKHKSLNVKQEIEVTEAKEGITPAS